MHLFGVSLTEPELIDALVFELVRGYTFEEVLEQVYKTEPRRLAISQVIIARAPVSTAIDPKIIEGLVAQKLTNLPPEIQFFGRTIKDVNAAFVRVPSWPVHLLFSHEHNHYLSANLNPTSSINFFDAGSPHFSSVIGNIQKAEIEIIVEAGRGRFPPIQGTLYEAPNGYLVPSFLRVGNLQRSRSAVDAIFFWLLPHLRGCAGIVTDTWSIGSIALNISRRLVSYRKPLELPCPVEMASSYPHGSDESASEAADQIERFIRLTGNHREPRKVIFLMSAISTGGLYTRVCKLLEQRAIDPKIVEFVSLFNLGVGHSPIPCLLDWSTSAGYGAFAPVERSTVESETNIIKIDEQTYFPSSFIDVPHGVREKEVQNIRQFLDRYPDISPFRVHRNVTDDGAVRHHAISVDTVTLCQHPAFQKRLADELLRLEPPPRLIITPVHDAGKTLAVTAMNALRQKEPNIVHIMHPDLLPTDDRALENKGILDLINGVDDQSAILILDDAFITGRRLSHYQMALRHVKFRGRVHYMVAVARPSVILDWENRCRMLKARPAGSPFADQGNTVSAIEIFALPDWNESECPWCNEFRIYQTFARDGQRRLSPALRQRRQLLEQSMHEGLRDNLFLMPPNVVSLSFTKDSKFAALGMSQASVFASVASGVQTLRSPEYEARAHRPALGPRHHPVATVLNHNEYLFATYSDSLLRACLLRAARDYELVYTKIDTEKEKSKRAIELITSPSRIESDVAAEIIIASLAHKFPDLKLNAEPPRQAIAHLGLSEMFGSLLEASPSQTSRK